MEVVRIDQAPLRWARTTLLLRSAGWIVSLCNDPWQDVFDGWDQMIQSYHVELLIDAGQTCENPLQYRQRKHWWEKPIMLVQLDGTFDAMWIQVNFLFHPDNFIVPSCFERHVRIKESQSPTFSWFQAPHQWLEWDVGAKPLSFSGSKGRHLESGTCWAHLHLCW